MDKRALSAIPRPELTDKQKEFPLLVSGMSYLVTVQRMNIANTDTLIINFFYCEKKKLTPEFRTFCTFEDYISQDLTVKNTKWKYGAINSLAHYLYWYKKAGNIVVASIEERKVMMDFLNEFKAKYKVGDYKRCTQTNCVVDVEIENRIDEYQDKIKEWRLEKKHREITDKIDAEMEKFGDVPDDYPEFVHDTVFDEDNYIFYSMATKKAYCSKCGFEFKITKDKYLEHEIVGIWNHEDVVKHNHTVRCPHCNKFLHCKSEGIGKGKLTAVRWSVMVEANGNEVLTRYFLHTKDFTLDYRNPKITTDERYRTVHSAERSRDYEWGKFKNTNQIRWTYFKDRSYGWYGPSEYACPRTVTLYNKDIEKDIAGTCMKYSAIGIFIEKIVKEYREFNKAWIIDNYFNEYRKNPFLEQLLKVGFYRLTRDFLDKDKDRRPDFKNERTVMESLGINKMQLNLLRTVPDPSLRDLKIIKYAGMMKEDDFHSLRLVHDNGIANIYEEYIDLMRHTTLHRIQRYITEQKIHHDSDYFDYIHWLEKMQYDMDNEFNLYPRDFKKAHDEKSAEYVKWSSMKKQEERKRFNKLLKEFRRNSKDIDAMNLRVKGLFIRLPYKLTELKTEGEILHHCVGTYIDRVAAGKTMIFFIRKEADPDTPYYTLEWNGKLIQCRGKHNCEMTPEVKAFAELFSEKMTEHEKSLQKKRKAG